MPTAGTTLALFALIGCFVEQASRPTLIAMLVASNPPVKWTVYDASFWLDSYLLRPVSGASVVDMSLSSDLDILLQQLVGSTVLAAVLTVVGYAVTLQLTRLYHQRQRSTSPAGAAESRSDDARPDVPS